MVYSSFFTSCSLLLGLKRLLVFRITAIVDRLIIGLVLAISVHAFDDLAITTMMPSITEELNGQRLYGAGFYSYLLASLISLIWAGAYTDQKGPRKPFLVGILVFVVGLLVSANASTMWAFIAGRSLQGLGAGAIHSVVFASINIAYDENKRRRAISYLTSAWILPSLIAPSLAGYVTTHWHWSYVFFGLSVPALFSGVVVYKRLGELNVDRKNGDSNKSHFLILPRALRIAFGLALFLVSISLVNSYWVLPLCLLSILIFWKPLHSLFPVDIWHAEKGLSAALTLKLTLVFAFFGCEAFIPLILIEHYHYSPVSAGVVLTTAALSWILATFIYDRVAERFNEKSLLIMGSTMLGLGVLGLWFFLLVMQWPSMTYFVWGLTAFGMGFVYPMSINLTMSNTNSGDEGKTSTASGAMDALGFSLAAGVGSAMLNVGELMGYSVFESMHAVWLIMFVVSLVALAICVRRY